MPIDKPTIRTLYEDKFEDKTLQDKVLKDETLREIEELCKKTYPESNKNHSGKEINEVYKNILDQVNPLKEGDKGLFLYATLDLLQNLSKKESYLKKVKSRIKEAQKAENIQTAGKIDVNRLNIEEREKMGVPINEHKPLNSSTYAAGAIGAIALSPFVVAGAAAGAVVGASATPRLATELLSGGSKEQKEQATKRTDQIYSPIGLIEKNKLEQFKKDCEFDIGKTKSAFEQFILKKQGLDGALTQKDQRGKYVALDFSPEGNSISFGKRLADNTAKCLFYATREVFHNTVGAGIITESNPTKDKRWSKFTEFRNEFLADIRNHPELSSHIELRKILIERELDEGLISKEEFNALHNLVSKQSEYADEEHKKYLENLEKMAQKANESLLEKVGNDLNESDNLQKYRVLQLMLLFSPMLPIPIVGVLFNMLEPFLSGAETLGDFLPSIFSVDGPFGQLAFVTDKMEIDKFVDIATNDWFGGPIDVVGGLLQNGITTPIMESIGQGAAGSPMAPLALSLLLEVATGSIGKDFDRMNKASEILPEAEKNFHESYKALQKQQKERKEEEDKNYLKKELNNRENFFKLKNAPGKVAENLLNRFKEGEAECEKFVNSFLLSADKPEESKKLAEKQLGSVLDILNSKDGDKIKNLSDLFYRQANSEEENFIEPLFDKILEGKIEQDLKLEFLKEYSVKIGIEDVVKEALNSQPDNTTKAEEIILSAMFKNMNRVDILKTPSPSPKPEAASKLQENNSLYL